MGMNAQSYCPNQRDRPIHNFGDAGDTACPPKNRKKEYSNEHQITKPVMAAGYPNLCPKQANTDTQSTK
jgi:hypothetical protein